MGISDDMRTGMIMLKGFVQILSYLTCVLLPGAGSVALESSIPGIPGRDYPALDTVPPTLFSCRGQVNGGYYADPETGCQAFHICASNGHGELRKVSFLCPNGTLFQQEYFTCDWWFNVDCGRARSLWSLNTEVAIQRAAHSVPE